jgi:chemotaxis protein histidine kinase CheA
MEDTIDELDRKLRSLQVKLSDVQRTITATSEKEAVVKRTNPPQPHTLSVITAMIEQLQIKKTKLYEEIAALKERLQKKVKANANAAEAAAIVKQKKAEEAIAKAKEEAAAAAKAKEEAAAAAAKAKEEAAAAAAAKAKAEAAAAKAKAEAAAKASTAPPTKSANISKKNVVTGSKAATNKGVLDTPVIGTNDTTIKNNRSNKGIDQYTREHHDYMLQQIEEIEKQIAELKKNDLTPKKDKKLNEKSSGIQWRGGADASGSDASGSSIKNSVNTHIVNLEARIVELEKRIKQLEENCCNGFTESLIDQNKRKIANLKKQIELLKNGMYLDIFGELYHTIKIDPEGTEQPYDGILTLNAFFRNFGLDRRYVNETAAKDKWSREYVDDVLKVFNKYFGKDSNPYAVFKSQLLNDREKDSVLLCPHLKRRYETIQRDIVRETVSGSPMNPGRLEGIGHYYRRVWEDLDAFLRETQICKGKISLPKTPLKQPQFRLEVGTATATAATAATAAAPIRKNDLPTGAEYQLPSTKRKQTKFVKEGQAPPPKPEGTIAKFLRTTALPSSDTTLGQRTALPKEPGKPWKMFPSRKPKEAVTVSKADTNGVLYKPPVTTPLKEPTSPWWKRTPKSKAAQPTLKSKAAQPTPLTLHLINYLANNLGRPVLYPEPHRITLQKIPQLAQFVLKAMPTIPEYMTPNTTVLVNYLLNELGPADPNKFKQMMSRMKLPTFKRTQSTGYERMKNGEPIPLTIHLINHLANNLGGPVLYPQPHRITLQKIPQLSQFVLKAMPTIGNYVKPNTTVLANYLLNELGPVDPSKFKQMMGQMKFPSFKRTQSTSYERMKNGNPTPLTLQLINHLANNLGGPVLYPEPHRITLDKIPQLAQFVLKAMPTIGDYVEPNTTALVNYLVNIYGSMSVSAPQVSEVLSPNNVQLEEGPFGPQGTVLPSQQLPTTGTLMPKQTYKESVSGPGSQEPATGTQSSSGNELFNRRPGSVPGNAGPEFRLPGVVVPPQELTSRTLSPGNVEAVSGPGSQEPATGTQSSSGNELFNRRPGSVPGNAGPEFRLPGAVVPPQELTSRTLSPGNVEAVSGPGSQPPVTGPEAFGSTGHLLNLSNTINPSQVQLTTHNNQYNAKGEKQLNQIHTEGTLSPGNVEAVSGPGSQEPAIGRTGLGEDDLLGLTTHSPLAATATPTAVRINQNLASLFSSGQSAQGTDLTPPPNNNNNSSTIASNNLRNALNGENNLNILLGPQPRFINRGPNNFEQHENVGEPLNTINEGNENAANNNNNGPPAAPEPEERPGNLPQVPPQNPFNAFGPNVPVANTAKAPKPVAAMPPSAGPSSALLSNPVAERPTPFDGGKRSVNKRRRTLARK